MEDNILIEFARLDVPIRKTDDVLFLEMIKKETNEAAISNLYCYFLNQDNNSEIASLFINSLLEIIEEKRGIKIAFHIYECQTEVTTSKGKRIDILLTNTVEPYYAIIIENKVFHTLTNDLNEYWQFLNNYNSNRIGIVLTLSKTKLEEDISSFYLSITHKEWIDKIKSKGIPYNINAKEFIILNDFIKTLENLSMSDEINNQAKFYFDFSKKVNSAIQTKEEAFKYVDRQIIIAGEHLGYKFDEWTKYVKYLYLNESDLVYYTILTEELMSGSNKLEIIIELWQEKGISLADSLDKKLKEYKNFNLLGHRLYQGKDYLHYLSKTYQLTKVDIIDLKAFLINTLKADFEELMKIIHNELYPILIK